MNKHLILSFQEKNGVHTSSFQVPNQGEWAHHLVGSGEEYQTLDGWASCCMCQPGTGIWRHPY